MAKNKVMIDVIVDDKGTTKRVAVDAKKLGGALDSTAKSARNTDRQLKGAAQASANSTKNFSKMAQGISGGLVPAYAAFAAQIFALTAAFNFLKRAADLENLRQSQIAYAQTTGQAVNTITERLKQASQGMLGFREAAQSAAIGAAKGFSSSQLETLAEGSVKLSARLGRSYEDTYDRLVRGISKAEPELLDELGITLRLETATRRYAQALGVNQKALTEAQRSQAVYNEALRQLNQQTVGAPALANQFEVLLKTFEEIAQNITSKLLPLFTSLADFINKNADAAAVAFAALGTLILVNIAGLKDGIKASLVSLAGFAGSSIGLVGKTAALTGKVVGIGLEPVIKEIKEAEDKLLAAAKDSAAKARNAAKTLVGSGAKSTTLQKIAEGVEVTPQALGKLRKDLARVKKEIQETGETASSAFAGATVDSIEAVEKELKNLGRTSLTTGQKIKKAMAVTAAGGVKLLRGSVTVASLAFKGLGTAAKISGGVINKAMSLAMKGTFILAGIQAVYELFQKLAETPLTFVENVESIAAKVIKIFEGIINFVIGGINRIGEALPDRFKFEVDTVDLSDLAANVKNATDTVLSFAGTSREALAEREAQNKKEAEIKKKIDEQNEALKRQQAIVQALNKDLGIAKLETVEQRSQFINTQSIEKQIEAYLNAQNQLQEAQKRASNLTGRKQVENLYEQMNAEATISMAQENILGVLELAPKLKESILESLDIATYEEALNNPEILKKLGEIFAKQGEESASSFIRELSSIKDGANQLLQDLGGGDIVTARDTLQARLNSIKNMAGTLGEDELTSTAAGIKELKQQLADGGYTQEADKLLETLNKLIDARNQLDIRQSNLNVQKIQTAQLPGALRTQGTLENNATEAALKLEDARLALEEYAAVSANERQISEEVFQDNIRKREFAIQEAIEAKRIADRNLTEIGQLGNAVGNSLASSMQSAFNGLIQGTMSAKDAFASMAKSMLQAIAKVIAELLVAKALTAAFGAGGLFPGVGSFLGLGARTGGIFEQDPSMRYGGIAEKVQTYAGGGIAKGREAGYPAILHGTEAVVPLPNGKEIPVQMTNAGSTNNVVVNVSIDSKGNAESSTGQSTLEGRNLGNAVAVAVQKELQNQKRSGGILNPYGAA